MGSWELKPWGYQADAPPRPPNPSSSVATRALKKVAQPRAHAYPVPRSRRSPLSPLHMSLPRQHLQAQEQAAIDKFMRSSHTTATGAWAVINKARARKGIPEVGKCALHRFCRGATFVRGRSETRGRKRALSVQDERKLDQARARLLKKSKNEHMVRYEDVFEEAGLADKACKRVLEDTWP